MRRLTTWLALTPTILAVLAVSALAQASQPAPRPNIIWIMADDLGYGDLGCYGQQRIKTPHIDRLAAEGMRFTDCYAGSTVCAPSRCTLMTGLHTGHCRVRSNARVPLVPDDVTVAAVLQAAGYTCGIIGKWGLGEPDTSGIPNRQGFDHWFGYLNQRHAHNYYPDYLWRNQQRVPLANVVDDGVASQKIVYSAELFGREALEFVSRHHGDRFFLYLALTQPHANNEAGKLGMEVPDDAPYSHESWPQAQKNHAAMISYLDRQVGGLMARLGELGIDDETIVFFTSDNGPHREGGADPNFFDSSGPLRGIKRAMYEGGIRVPMIVRWPGHVPAGTTNAHAWAFWDALPTLAELGGGEAPEGLDGISVVPALLGQRAAGRPQPSHDYLYWEFPERGFKQAVRAGDWKAVRNKPAAPLELYNLASDLSESHNVADENPEIVARMEEILATARTKSDYLKIDRPPAGR